jgi:glutathione S-transferase
MRTLYVGSKRYSSWSLRPYLALAHSGLAFETKVILLDQPTTKAEILAVNPTGKIPVLHDDALVIWDSLAICEYAHELAGNLWPADRATRARARAISAEMHSGFTALRMNMGMDICATYTKPQPPEALADARRVMDIWRDALAASGGPFLFGGYTIADAMYAPIAGRFRSYGIELDASARAYSDAIFADPAWQAWQRDADAEPKTR